MAKERASRIEHLLKIIIIRSAGFGSCGGCCTTPDSGQLTMIEKRSILFYVLVLFIFAMLVFLPNSFAQGTLRHPSVRLVYFLPKDRPARPGRIKALRQLIKDAQQFYADEMERHGYGRKTFRIETDRTGEPIVHRFKGRFNERHYYQRTTDFKVWEEFFPQVNDIHHVYLIAIDLSYELLNEGRACGLGGCTFFPLHADTDWFFGSAAVRHRDITPGEEVLGGSAIIPASGHCFYDTRGFLHPLRATTHELAHAFGLEHNYSDPDSAVGGRGFRFSECDAEWLSMSRFFNSKAVSENASGNIQLISAPTYSPEGITLRFEVTDTDGLHQAQLLVPKDGSWGPWKFVGCQALEGHTQRVEFLSSELTSAPERVALQFMDDLGNITWATFLVDIASLLPLSKVVSIPDVPLPTVQPPVTVEALETETWLAVRRPSGISAANFVIEPGTFAILVHTNKRTVSQPADFQTYRLRSVLGAADFPNLADFFQNGGRIELVSHPSKNPLPPNTREPQFADVIISEIMWGLDRSDPGKQYIELYNASAHTYTFTNGDLMFRFSKASEEPLPAGIFRPPFNPKARLKVIDKVDNTDWKVPGQGGNISRDQPLISMYRAIDYRTKSVPDGTLANSWRASSGRVNLLPPSYGTPGAKHLPLAPVVYVGVSQRPAMYWIDTTAGTLHRLVATEVENLVPSVQNATSLAVDSTGNKLYWTERTSERTGKIRRSNLDGSNVQLVKDLTSVPLDFAVDAVNSKIYLTNAWGKVQRLNVDGSNFQPNLIIGLEAPKHIALDAADGRIYWTEQTSDTTGKIKRAHLNGSNVRLVKNLTSAPRGLALDTANRKLYLTNAYGKVQRLNVDGSNFQPNLITALDAPQEVSVDVAGRKLYGTERGSIWRVDLNGGNIEDVVTGLGIPTGLVLGTVPTAVLAAPAITGLLPNATVLLANYPNPFNPETWIPYQLSEPAAVRVTIYDFQGRVVRTLELGNQRAGIYYHKNRAAYWDGRNAVGERVASGVYFYTLSTGDFTATRKLLIQK